VASEVPRFRYHPDPIATGSVVPSDATCALCSEARGYIYTGPVHCEEEHEADRHDEPTAYLFRCISCRRYGGYSDLT
jgi:uncharacterized protein CbrC (UPF0167 family)